MAFFQTNLWYANNGLGHICRHSMFRINWTSFYWIRKKGFSGVMRQFLICSIPCIAKSWPKPECVTNMCRVVDKSRQNPVGRRWITLREVTLGFDKDLIICVTKRKSHARSENCLGEEMRSIVWFGRRFYYKERAVGLLFLKGLPLLLNKKWFHFQWKCLERTTYILWEKEMIFPNKTLGALKDLKKGIFMTTL